MIGTAMVGATLKRRGNGTPLEWVICQVRSIAAVSGLT
jgi:hypothetical protein